MEAVRTSKTTVSSYRTKQHDVRVVTAQALEFRKFSSKEITNSVIPCSKAHFRRSSARQEIYRVYENQRASLPCLQGPITCHT